jgi:hypothetical protein
MGIRFSPVSENIFLLRRTVAAQIGGIVPASSRSMEKLEVTFRQHRAVEGGRSVASASRVGARQHGLFTTLTTDTS